MAASANRGATARIADFVRLTKTLESATGGDLVLDRDIHQVFGAQGTVPPYSEDVASAISLVEKLCPAWKWHLGYSVNGILPYAVLSKGKQLRFEESAPTAPLALLRVMVRALRQDEVDQIQQQEKKAVR